MKDSKKKKTAIGFIRNTEVSVLNTKNKADAPVHGTCQALMQKGSMWQAKQVCRLVIVLKYIFSAILLSSVSSKVGRLLINSIFVPDIQGQMLRPLG